MFRRAFSRTPSGCVSAKRAQAGRSAAVGLLLLGACSGNPGVQILFPDGGPPLNDYFSMEVLVSGPEPDAVRVDADMPAHKHGMVSKPALTPLGDGRWQVDGMMLHMPGHWEVWVEVDRGEDTRRAVFEVRLEPFSE